MHKGIKIIDRDKPSDGAKLRSRSLHQERPAVNGAEAKVAEPNKGGRPLKYSTPAALQEAIDRFFEEERYPTLTGLGYHLELSRSSMFDYRKRDDFSNIMETATQRVEVIYEKKLIYGNGKNTSGIIFALKRMGWKAPVEEETEQSTIQDTFTKKIEEVNQLYLKKAR